MKKTGENETHEFFTDQYPGVNQLFNVRFYKHKVTGEISINSEDAAKCMGYPNFGEMMADKLTLSQDGISSNVDINNDTEQEKVIFMADQYGHLIGGQEEDEDGPASESIKAITINNPSIGDIQIVSGYELLENGDKGAYSCAIHLLPEDGHDLILTRDDLVNLIKTIDTVDQLANG